MINKHPLDFGNLKKGDVISELYLFQIFAKEPTSLELLELRQRVINETGFTVKIEKNELHILKDAEASQYNYKQSRNGIKKIVSAHSRNLRVDITKLTENQEIDHQKRLLGTGATIAAIAQAQTEPGKFLETEKRKTPVLKEA